MDSFFINRINQSKIYLFIFPSCHVQVGLIRLNALLVLEPHLRFENTMSVWGFRSDEFEDKTSTLTHHDHRTNFLYICQYG